MPDVRLKGVEVDNAVPSNASFPVTVKIQNRETVGPLGTDHDYCSGNNGNWLPATSAGHQVNVKLTVHDANGQVVYEELKEDVCASLSDGAGSVTFNTDRISFDVDALSPGEHTLRAGVTGLRADDTWDYSDNIGFEVGEGTEGADDAGSPATDGSIPEWLPGSNDGDGGNETDDERNDQGDDGSGGGGLAALLGLGGGGGGGGGLGAKFDQVTLVIGLLALAWLADSGSDFAN